jgi:hypothetical protein
MTIPCIAMTSTRPIFYLVPATRELSEAVATARYPRSPTVVKKCIAASNSRRLSEGMENPSFREVALQNYTAFRPLAEAHRSAFMIPMELEENIAIRNCWNTMPLPTIPVPLLGAFHAVRVQR